MMKKSVSILLSCLMCLAIVGCGTEYEDTNGADNFELQTITDENITALDIGASGLGYSEGEIGGIVFSSGYTADNFNGVERLYAMDFIIPSDVTVYIGHMNIKSGNFKLVAINNDEIIHEFALDSFGESFVFEDIKGTFAIHVAGESAAFEFYLDVY